MEHARWQSKAMPRKDYNPVPAAICKEKGVTYVHDPTVDVAKFLEAEQPRAMSRVIECEALQNQLAYSHLFTSLRLTVVA